MPFGLEKSTLRGFALPLDFEKSRSYANESSSALSWLWPLADVCPSDV
jgi:hypothetical protein